MKNIRPMGWLIIAFNAYYLYAFSKGIVDISAEGGGDKQLVYTQSSHYLFGLF
jgi:hypothetical protein